MRSTDAEWYSNHKSTWISQAMESVGWGIGENESTIDILDDFFEIMVTSIDTRAPGVADELLANWVNTQLPSQVLGSKILLPSLLRQLMQATYITCETFLSGNRLTDTYESAVQFFSYCFEKSAEFEVLYRLTAASVDMEAIEKGSAKLELSKSAFIEITAHELRTPISLIKGYTSMLESSLPKDQDNNASLRLLNGITQGVTRLNEIINNMLMVAMIDNNRLDLSFQPVWVGKIIKGIRDEYEDTLNRRNIKFNLKGVSSKEQMIMGDPIRLHQAFGNLILNAIKFTPDNGKINITLRDNNEYSIVTIEDSGIGISKTNQLRLFNRFNYLGDVSHYSAGKSEFKSGGPGLGLYIAKGIIDAHQGNINVYSQGYDETNMPGTIFTVTLPTKQSQSIKEK